MLSLGENQVLTAPYLLKQGYSYDNLKGYVRSGYLDSLGRGAYCRAGSQPTVEAAITAMSGQMGVPVHLGGRSALAKRGYVHFVPFTELPATVFMDHGVRVPAWFGHHYVGRFLMRKTSFIKGNSGIENDAGCPVSSPERAVLEFLLDVPARQLLNEAYQLLEMMMTLRPRLIEKLLSDCSGSSFSIRITSLRCVVAWRFCAVAMGRKSCNLSTRQSSMATTLPSRCMGQGILARADAQGRGLSRHCSCNRCSGSTFG